METEAYIDTETYEFDFGKFSGYSYQFVLNQDPFYIKWLTENVEDFLLDPTASLELLIALESRSLGGQ